MFTLDITFLSTELGRILRASLLKALTQAAAHVARAFKISLLTPFTVTREVFAEYKVSVYGPHIYHY